MIGEFWLMILADIMGWTDTQAKTEYEWIRLMAQYKYDSYRDYQAGQRFVESLANWLQQFNTIDERVLAYEFVKSNLIFIGIQEIERLIKQFYNKFVYKKLLSMTALNFGIPSYALLKSSSAKQYFEQIQRRTLFMGLSDGARLDVLRRSNVGRISNEQVVIATQVDENKWKSLKQDLEIDLAHLARNQKEYNFCVIYLIDDFMGTGLSFLRKEDIEDGKKVWKGKLIKFLESMHAPNIRSIFSNPIEICVHHFIGTEKAKNEINQRFQEMKIDLNDKYDGINVSFSFSLVLDESIKISENTEEGKDFLNLCRKYYNPNIETKHTSVGGGSIMNGFGGCALPLVLEHNCPNNTIPLLWAEIAYDEENNYPEMIPLFRRRQRHS